MFIKSLMFAAVACVALSGASIWSSFDDINDRAVIVKLEEQGITPAIDIPDKSATALSLSEKGEV